MRANLRRAYAADPAAVPLPSARRSPDLWHRWMAVRQGRTVQWLLRAAFAAGLVAVGAASLLPRVAMPEISQSDKAWHAICYAIVAANGVVLVRGWQRLTLAIGLIAFGAVLEVIQSHLPGRDASLLDGVSNAAGVALGIALVAALSAVIKAVHGRRAERAAAG